MISTQSLLINCHLFYSLLQKKRESLPSREFLSAEQLREMMAQTATRIDSADRKGSSAAPISLGNSPEVSPSKI